MQSDFNLFEEFPPVSRSAWEEKITSDLNGDNYKETLRWETGEGIDVLPFYRHDDLQSLPDPLDDNQNNWQICQSIDEPDITKANQMARDAVQKGADEIEFLSALQEGNHAIKGVQIHSQQSFNTLIEGIDLSNTGLHFNSGAISPVVLGMLHNACKQQSIDTASVTGSVNFDPYAFSLAGGQLPEQPGTYTSQAAQIVEFCQSRLPSIKCLSIDARLYQNAGATIVQELGYALATGSEYLAQLSEAGLKTDQIASAIHLNFAIGSNYFLEIAKFRAARKLWRSLLDAYEVTSNEQAYIRGSSSSWNKTMYDPYVNMLRTTTEGMAAAAAGCDSITLHPFDDTFHQADTFSQRIARNSQIILKEEAYFNKVADPAAGSYYIETLTNKIAREAWQCFQQIEEQGGFLKAITNGQIQAAIEESRHQKDQAIARRGRTFVGTNQYPNAEENSPDKKENTNPRQSLQQSNIAINWEMSSIMPSLKDALRSGASIGDITPQLFDFDTQKIPSVQPYRGPQAFEELRKATEQHPQTPQVLTIPMGSKKMRKARSAFTNNFFGCVGYDIEDPIGFASVNEAVTEIKNQQPDIAVLCSSDEEYKELVPELCEKINKLDEKPIIVLAGYPKEQIEQFRDAGVDMFIHAKCNVLETLRDFQQKLEIIS